MTNWDELYEQAHAKTQELIALAEKNLKELSMLETAARVAVRNLYDNYIAKGNLTEEEAKQEVLRLAENCMKF
jgi:uncharacterized protein (DUF39 family)